MLSFTFVSRYLFFFFVFTSVCWLHFCLTSLACVLRLFSTVALLLCSSPCDPRAPFLGLTSFPDSFSLGSFLALLTFKLPLTIKVFWLFASELYHLLSLLQEENACPNNVRVGGVSLAHSLMVQPIAAGTLRCLVGEGTGHISPTIRKQREMNVGGQLAFSSNGGSLTMEWYHPCFKKIPI